MPWSQRQKWMETGMADLLLSQINPAKNPSSHKQLQLIEGWAELTKWKSSNQLICLISKDYNQSRWLEDNEELIWCYYLASSKECNFCFSFIFLLLQKPYTNVCTFVPQRWKKYNHFDMLPANFETLFKLFFTLGSFLLYSFLFTGIELERGHRT